MCIAFVLHVVGIVDCHGCIFLLVVNLFVSFCILLVVQLTQTFSFFRLSLLIVYIRVFNFCVWFVWYSVGYGALNNFCFVFVWINNKVTCYWYIFFYSVYTSDFDSCLILLPELTCLLFFCFFKLISNK